MVSLKALLDLLDRTPVVAEMHPVSRCYLPDDVVVYETADEPVSSLDMPTTTLPERGMVLQAAPLYAGRFPHVCVHHDPFTPLLNDVLYDRFDEIAALMLVQSQLPERISRESGKPDVVALVLIDGLSYGDTQHWLDAHPGVDMALEPCLVDGPTLTEAAFPRLIGDPPLAMRFFDRGYQSRLGFTYWSRESNRLTDVLFHTIPDVRTAGDFPTILADLRSVLNAKNGLYVQILRTGLDGYAHHQKRAPPVAAVVDTIMDEMLALAGMLHQANRTARIYLTADHGILWRDEFDPQIIGRAPPGASPRCCEWRDLYQQDESGRRFAVAGREVYSLGYPKLRRALRIDEQGVHGGISFQESVVPFLTIRVGDIC